MKVSCAVPIEVASEGFAERLAELGIKPIITPKIIRAVYDGPSSNLANKIVSLFEAEPDHDIVVIKPKNKGTKHKKGSK